jgi:hypothetical protein
MLLADVLVQIARAYASGEGASDFMRVVGKAELCTAWVKRSMNYLFRGKIFSISPSTLTKVGGADATMLPSCSICL